MKRSKELTDAIRRNVTIDFNVRKQAQATMRSVIRRLLKKYRYPPEQAKEALEIVMKQVELMCTNETSDCNNTVSYPVRMMKEYFIAAEEK